MMDAKQLLEYIIRPVLKDLDLWSEAAERLVLGTACQESACGQYVHQIEGPALGIYQMEPATHDDIHENFIRFDDGLRGKIKDYNLMAMPIDAAHEMIGNLYYATAMCRIHYLRVPEPIPDYLGGQAQYWKTHYNSEKGAGTVQQYMNNWNRYVTPGVV